MTTEKDCITNETEINNPEDLRRFFADLEIQAKKALHIPWYAKPFVGPHAWVGSFATAAVLTALSVKWYLGGDYFGATTMMFTAGLWFSQGYNCTIYNTIYRGRDAINAMNDRHIAFLRKRITELEDELDGR